MADPGSCRYRRRSGRVIIHTLEERKDSSVHTHRYSFRRIGAWPEGIGLWPSNDEAERLVTDPVETGTGIGGFGTLDAKTLIDQLVIAYSAESSGILQAACAKVVAADIGVNGATSGASAHPGAPRGARRAERCHACRYICLCSCKTPLKVPLGRAEGVRMETLKTIKHHTQDARGPCRGDPTSRGGMAANARGARSRKTRLVRLTRASRERRRFFCYAGQCEAAAISCSATGL